MKLKMRDEDRRAMDILMDRASTNGKPHDALYAAIDSRLRERIVCVEKVLGLLDNMPVFEPPRDLAASTLRFVEESRGQRATTRPGSAGLFNNHGPLV